MAFNAGSITAFLELNTKNFDANAKKTKSGLGGIKDAVFSVQGVMAGLAGSGMVLFAKSAVNAAAKMEQTRVSFETMVGSADEANKLIGELTEFANKTPFENFDVTDSAKTLLAYGTRAEDIEKTLKAVGDVASGAGVPLNDMASIFGKISASGLVFTEDLNQLSNRGVPILDVLADKFGVTALEVREMASQGKITSEDMNEAFQVMTSEGGMFFNMMESQSETVNGKLSTIAGKFQNLMVIIGEKLFPIVKPVLDQVIAVIDLVSQAISGEGGLSFSVDNLWMQFSEKFPQVAEVITRFSEIVMVILTNLQAFWAEWGSTILLAVQNAFDLIWFAIKSVVDLIVTTVNVGLAVMQGDWQGAMEAILGFAERMKERVLGVFTRLMDRAKEIFENIRSKIAEALDMDKRNSPSINDRLGMIRDGISTVFDGVQLPQISSEIASSLDMSMADRNFNQNVNINTGAISSGVDISSLGREFAFRTQSQPGVK